MTSCILHQRWYQHHIRLDPQIGVLLGDSSTHKQQD